MNNNIQIVGELTNKVTMPLVHVGKGLTREYKAKAYKFFETMEVGQSFTVKSRSIEGVKRWNKDWRRDLRAGGSKADLKLAERGFLTKHEIVDKTNGCRVWRFK